MVTAKTIAKKTPRQGRPPAHEIASRNEKLLDIATEVFLEAGYTGAKMTLIAKRAGASMETLYLRYPTKAQLFAALIERKSSGMLELIGPMSPDRNPQEALVKYAIELIGMMSKPDTQQLHRLVIAGSIESPELGKTFWEAGPGRGFKILRTYLYEQQVRGSLVVRDPDQAAGLFMGMTVGGIALRSTLGMPNVIRTTQQQRVWASHVVKVFLQSLC